MNADLHVNLHEGGGPSSTKAAFGLLRSPQHILLQYAMLDLSPLLLCRFRKLQKRFDCGFLTCPNERTPDRNYEYDAADRCQAIRRPVLLARPHRGR